MTCVLGRREAGYRSEGMERGGRRSEMKHDTSEPPESLAIGFMMDPAIVEGPGISRHNKANRKNSFENITRKLNLTQEERKDKECASTYTRPEWATYDEIRKGCTNISCKFTMMK